jgi:tyrosyl-tRNA synthetase
MKSILEYRGIEDVISRPELEKKLKEGKKLRIKFGCDPSRPDIHLGHTVPLRLLKQFQDAGHEVIFLIGDYTSRIGDPSGRNAARPILSDKEIESNSATYFDQVSKVINIKKTEIRYNSEWYKELSFSDLLKLTSLFTVSQIIERDDFEKRLKTGIEVGMQELLYPIMQAYDSVILKADVEIGGTDQRFNLLAGRELQKKVGQIPQDIMTCKLLVGLDGKEKMSKSLGNYIGVTEPADQIFGKAMSINDEQIVSYFSLLTDLSDAEVADIEKKLKEGFNPRDLKFKLAETLTTMYSSKDEAESAGQKFNQIHRKKEIPDDILEVELSGQFDIVALLAKLLLITSNSEGRRLVEQGGVKVDGATITEIGESLKVYPGMVVQVGKRKFIRIK